MNKDNSMMKLLIIEQMSKWEFNKKVKVENIHCKIH